MVRKPGCGRPGWAVSSAGDRQRPSGGRRPRPPPVAGAAPDRPGVGGRRASTRPNQPLQPTAGACADSGFVAHRAPAAAERGRSASDPREDPSRVCLGRWPGWRGGRRRPAGRRLDARGGRPAGLGAAPVAVPRRRCGVGGGVGPPPEVAGGARAPRCRAAGSSPSGRTRHCSRRPGRVRFFACARHPVVVCYPGRC